MKLENKVALITAAAEASAKRSQLRLRGKEPSWHSARAAQMSFSKPSLSLAARRRKAEGWTCDVTIESSVKEFVHGAQRKLGGSIFWSTTRVL